VTSLIPFSKRTCLAGKHDDRPEGEPADEHQHSGVGRFRDAAADVQFVEQERQQQSCCNDEHPEDGGVAAPEEQQQGVARRLVREEEADDEEREQRQFRYNKATSKRVRKAFSRGSRASSVSNAAAADSPETRKSGASMAVFHSGRPTFVLSSTPV
jgi:hypothetical protein